MTDHNRAIDDMRRPMDKLLESIRTERSEQPLNMMSSGDVRAFNDKIRRLRAHLEELAKKMGAKPV